MVAWTCYFQVFPVVMDRLRREEGGGRERDKI